ncbi:SRPBCC family protein [Homoserinibacter sp. YIM 151385]|uniref:SRPBCC family protein n=1 Tax=Homoserinibacter sp. YIM 151385 TaxID=2985506 RepID=UPI0022F0F81D|nr:SRPBCC domain-containing protein [Homoserinibacter sp. YIM 151385]WBU39090.1 SRPBCC domain-containing protein [Homoserinibacter sp. YIM 151385]
MSSIPAVPEVTDRDVFITRAFDAPRDVVWRFWTEPEHLSRWFGPAEVHVDSASVLVQPHAGGRWDLDMVDDQNGATYPLRAVLRQVIPPEYLEGVIEAGSEDGEISGVTLRVWFHDHGERTRITIHQGPFTAEHRDMTIDGWESSFLKLDAIWAGGAA